MSNPSPDGIAQSGLRRARRRQRHWLQAQGNIQELLCVALARTSVNPDAFGSGDEQTCRERI
ncbi:hypothetical protein FJU30_16460 [Affinibrenneria salicis]|uniref:Uncharacterized protein n=1 Tax=Affinibrenneria salicis TaxID=2590031 RepID=A0A5J5FXL7_9GAMM|nr:hypothetical protein [Affinibrenneria salicis]KAA8998589.1 hypothetical protein FJU30_16460 [Affinibrenneria salicis]